MDGGTVSGRVDLLPRSAEVKPLIYRFVKVFLNFSFAFCPEGSGGSHKGRILVILDIFISHYFVSGGSYGHLM